MGLTLLNALRHDWGAIRRDLDAILYQARLMDDRAQADALYKVTTEAAIARLNRRIADLTYQNAALHQRLEDLIDALGIPTLTDIVQTKQVRH